MFQLSISPPPTITQYIPTLHAYNLCLSYQPISSTHHHPVHTHITWYTYNHCLYFDSYPPPTITQYIPTLHAHNLCLLYQPVSSTHHQYIPTLHGTHTTIVSISTLILHPPSPSTYPHYMHTTSVSLISTRILHPSSIHTHITWYTYNLCPSIPSVHIPTLHGPRLTRYTNGDHYSPIPTYTLPVGPIAGPTPTAHVEGHPYARTRFKSGLDSLLINLISPVPIHLWISDRIYLD